MIYFSHKHLQILKHWEFCSTLYVWHQCKGLLVFGIQFFYCYFFFLIIIDKFQNIYYRSAAFRVTPQPEERQGSTAVPSCFVCVQANNFPALSMLTNHEYNNKMVYRSALLARFCCTFKLAIYLWANYIFLGLGKKNKHHDIQILPVMLKKNLLRSTQVSSVSAGNIETSFLVTLCCVEPCFLTL